MGIGNYLKALNRQHIQATGQSLNVFRPAKIGGASSNRAVVFTPQPMSILAVAEYNPEGTQNAADGRACDFVAAADVDVLKGDEIGPYDGATWVVIAIPTEAQTATPTVKHCIAIANGA